MFRLNPCKFFPFAKLLLPHAKPPENEQAKMIIADAERKRADVLSRLFEINQELTSRDT